MGIHSRVSVRSVCVLDHPLKDYCLFNGYYFRSTVAGCLFSANFGFVSRTLKATK